MAQRKAMDLVPALKLLLDPKAEQGTPQGRHAIQQFGLAVHYLMKHWLLTERPQLIQSAEPGRLELFGGLYVTREGAELKSNVIGLFGSSVGDIGLRLLDAANGKIYGHFRARMLEHLQSEARKCGVDLGRTDAEACQETKDTIWLDQKVVEGQTMKNVEWALDWVMSNMKVHWWSRKTTKRVEVLTLNKYIWDLGVLDREVYGLVLRVGGMQSTLSLYNRCASHKEALQARAKEAPNLMPLLYDGNDVLEGDNAFQLRREQFLAQGGTPAGWRWLTRQGWSVVNRFFRTDTWCGDAIVFANLLAGAQVGKLPAIRSMFLVGSFTFKLKPTLGLRYAEAVRLLSQVYQKRKQKVGELADTWPLVWDYVRANHERISLRKATWASLVRRQDEWHRAQLRERRERDKASRGCYEWKALVQEVAHKGYTATSLNTTDALWEEGDAMGHCVGGYHYQCFQNSSRIFSILNPEGQRVATLEARLYNGKWQLNQLYAQRNRPIQNPVVKALAALVIRQCNKAPKLEREDNKVIREPVRTQAHRPAERAAPALPNREMANADGVMDIPF